MNSIIDRVKSLGLPLDSVVVLGSGLLDAYGLRPSNDVDVAVGPKLYAELRSTEGFVEGEKDGSIFLSKGDLEVWQDWGADTTYEKLLGDAITVRGVKFVDPALLIRKKRERGWDKDMKDVTLLEEYLRESN